MSVVYLEQRLVNIFNGKKLKTARNLQQNFAKKNMFFKFAPKHSPTVLFQKNAFFSKITYWSQKQAQSGNIHSIILNVYVGWQSVLFGKQDLVK